MTPAIPFRALPAGLHEQHDHLQRGQGQLTPGDFAMVSLCEARQDPRIGALMSPWCLFAVF